jgi:3-isopropylmalate dehydrogenase
VAPPTTTTSVRGERGWLARIRDPQAPDRPESALIGVLPGEGIGPEVVASTLEVLPRLEAAGGRPVALEYGGPIGQAAEREVGSVLPDEVVGFCQDVFERGGAVLSGPGGGRYVYDLRRRLGLFLKISPIQVRLGLADASTLRPDALDGVDFLVARENLGGLYQGRSDEVTSDDGGRLIEHRLSYGESDVRRFLEAAARLAGSRRGNLTVVVKQAGAPQLSDLWRECATEAAHGHGVDCSFVDIDLMAYRLVERPRAFDVIAAPNLFGDVLGDLAAVLLGSRGLSFGASFSPRGDGVYQTNHGAAYDIAGSGRANPVGQILSLAMMLRESLGLEREAWALEEGVRGVWSDGGRTDDLGGTLGTAEMAERVATAAAERLAAAPE